MNKIPFVARRARLIEQMSNQGGGVAIIPTAPERVRNRDTYYPYRADSYFHYLTGFDEPDAVLLLISGDGRSPIQSILFCRARDTEKEIWDGFRWGPDMARDVFGFDVALPIDDFDMRLPEFLSNQPALWYSLGYDAVWDQRVAVALNAVRAQARNGMYTPACTHDIRVMLDDMRLVKDQTEIEIMRQAARISSGGHRRAMQVTRPGMQEYEIEAELLHEFRRHGCLAPAYPCIVAGGANACILHYVANDHILNDGDLLLIDAGCEMKGYASDITRTFPINGRFSGPQADLYQVVLDAQHAAITAISPGVDFRVPHEAAIKSLTRGLVDIGLLKGNIDGLIESGAYRRFYMHRTSHWLGRDVHDVGSYRKDDMWRTLQSGMVLTIEPGCYVRASDDIPKVFHNVGIRIEDDVLVTTEGCDVITQESPKTITEIEALMAETGQ